jgi:alkylation response protein AidB-like acyl-CoA dehydrogenase
MDRMGGADGLHDVLAVVAREAASGAADGRLTPAAVTALGAAGLFKLFLPADLGGGDRPLPDAVRVISRIAQADGAAGWAAMIGSGPNWFAGHMPPALAAAVFGPADSVVAGSGLLGRATATDGGWRVDGRWRWCSGAPWATWFTFNAATDDGVITVAVPAADVALDTASWDVHGLRATASWDAALAGAFVPSAHAFVIDPAAPLRPEPIFRVPFFAFAEATMAAVAVGVARGLLDGFADLARTKVPTFGSVVLADQPVVRDRLARAEAAARAAARSLDVAVAAVWDAAVAGRVAATDAELDVRLAACHAAVVAAEVAAAVQEHSGMTVLDRASPLGRAVADARALPQNAVVGAGRFADVGAALLGRSPNGAA